MVLSVAYAYLCEQAEAADSAAIPLYSVNGAKDDELDDLSRRKRLDAWLDAPYGHDAANDATLLDFLNA